MKFVQDIHNHVLRSSTLKKKTTYRALKSAFKSDAELPLHLNVLLKGIRKEFFDVKKCKREKGLRV